MLQTDLLYWQFPQEYLISLFEIAQSIHEEPDQPLPRLDSRVTVNEIACFTGGRGTQIHFIFKMFLEGLICGNAESYLKLVKNVGFTEHKNNLLKVWKGRGAVVWGRSLRPRPPSVQCAVCLRAPRSSRRIIDVRSALLNPGLHHSVFKGRCNLIPLLLREESVQSRL